MRDGHDGTWVAHPALVPVARAIFEAGMPQPNQVRACERSSYHRAARRSMLAVCASDQQDCLQSLPHTRWTLWRRMCSAHASLLIRFWRWMYFEIACKGSHSCI